MALTIDQQKFVQELANLAYGTGGNSERSAGGKGNMGLMYGADGAVHVVKFNTHHSQAKTAQSEANKGAASVQSALEASNALRTELEKLARFAGMDKKAVDELLGNDANGRSLLTRKVIAGFVNHLAAASAELNGRQIWQKAEEAARNLKSASDMSFAKVSAPDAQHAKFNRAVEGLNGAVSSRFLKVCDAVKGLGWGGNPFGTIEGWKGAANSQLTAATIEAAEARVRRLEARGYGWLGEMGAAEAMTKAFRTKRPELDATAAAGMVDYFVRYGDFGCVLTERICAVDPVPFDDAVGFFLEKAEALEKRGFGWLVRGESCESDLYAEIRSIKPEYSEIEARVIAYKLAGGVKSGSWDIAQGHYMGRQNESFHVFVENYLKEGRAGETIARIRHEAASPLVVAVATLLQKFEESRFNHPAENDAEGRRMRAAIHENIGVLLDMALHYDEAIEVLGGPENGLAEAAKIDEALAKATAKKDEAAVKKAKARVQRFEAALALKTADGKKLGLHAGNGLVALINVLKFAHDFDKCLKAVLDKDAANHNGAALEGLLQSLTEGGCFQARMELLQGYISQLNGINAVDEEVAHKEGETVREGLINELAKAAEKFVREHPDKEPTWKNVKETFELRVKGKRFAGVTWSAMKIYETLATFEPPKDAEPGENEILTYSGVVEDADFREAMKTIEQNRLFDEKRIGAHVHMGQL